MLMIVTALYCEAQPFIEYYHLKKDQQINKFQVFQNEEIKLIITSTGSIAAAVGVSYLCNSFPPSADDFMINIGACASNRRDIPSGTVYFCNKIMDEVTGRSFYPDILYKHPFAEGSILTCGRIKSKEQIDNYGDEMKLIDMEAAGIYQAAAYYFQQHQLSFIKIISDYGAEKEISQEIVSQLVKQNLTGIITWLDLLKKAGKKDQPVFTLEEEASINNIAKNLRCSVTMEYQLRQMFHYYKLIHGNFIGAKDFLPNYAVCKTKSEGKMYFEQLKSQLL